MDNFNELDIKENALNILKEHDFLSIIDFILANKSTINLDFSDVLLLLNNYNIIKLINQKYDYSKINYKTILDKEAKSMILSIGTNKSLKYPTLTQVGKIVDKLKLENKQISSCIFSTFFDDSLKDSEIRIVGILCD